MRWSCALAACLPTISLSYQGSSPTANTLAADGIPLVRREAEAVAPERGSGNEQYEAPASFAQVLGDSDPLLMAGHASAALSELHEQQQQQQQQEQQRRQAGEDDEQEQQRGKERERRRGVEGRQDLPRQVAVGDRDHGYFLLQEGALNSNATAMKLPEGSEACLLTQPPEDCLLQYGVSNFKHLTTKSWRVYEAANQLRTGWMAHSRIQQQKISNITWPGTHASGSYTFAASTKATAGTFLVNGMQKQNLDVLEQMEIGVRAIQIDVCVDYEDNNRLYTCNEILTAPLSTVLDDAATFLKRNPSELLMLSIQTGKARPSTGLSDYEAKFTDPLLVINDGELPGQIVHEAVVDHLGDILITYNALERLNDTEDVQDPTVAGLVALDARVLYFWEGQQVLCTSVKMCSATPMWSESGFNEAKKLGLIYKPFSPASSSSSAEHFVAPGCIVESLETTRTSSPVKVAGLVKTWADGLPSIVKSTRPKCYPSDLASPNLHQPPIFFWANAYVSPPSQEKVNYRQMKSNFVCGVGDGFPDTETLKCKDLGLSDTYSECFTSAEVCFKKLLPFVAAGCTAEESALGKCCGPYFSFKQDAGEHGICNCPIKGGSASASSCEKGEQADGVKVFAVLSESQVAEAISNANLNLTSNVTLDKNGSVLTISTVSEFANFLTVGEFMYKDSQEELHKPNVIAMDFVVPVMVARIVESQQAQSDCGITVYCNKYGDCGARSLLWFSTDDEAKTTETGYCVTEDEAVDELDGRTERKEEIYGYIGLTIAFGLVIFAMYSMCKNAGTTKEGEEEELEEEEAAAAAEAEAAATAAGGAAAGPPAFGGNARPPAAAPAPAPAAPAAPAPSPMAPQSALGGGSPAAAPAPAPAPAPAAAPTPAPAPAPAPPAAAPPAAPPDDEEENF